MITRRQALTEYKTSVALAEALGVTKSRVSQWKYDDPLPERYELKLRYVLKPGAFEGGE